MDPTIFEFNGVRLRIVDPVLSFIAGRDREARWKARGLSGHNEDQTRKSELEAEERQAIEQLKQSPEGQKKNQDFS